MLRSCLAAFASMSLLLTGCSSGEPAGDKVTLVVAWWGNPARTKATNAAIDLFTKKFPKIEVKVRPSAFPGYYDKLNTEFASGAAPDVFQDDQVRTYAAKGLLLDLGAHQDVLKTDALGKEFLAQGTIDGKLMDVPAGASPMALVHQPKLLEGAGVSAPTARTSWQDFAALATKLAGGLPKGTWALADSSAQHNHLQVFLRQKGKDWFTADGTALGFAKEDLAEWWTFWAGLRAKGVVPPADVTSGSAGGDVSQDPVAAKKVAMSVYGTSISLPREDWKYGPLPGEAERPGSHLMRSVSWAINAKTKHPRESAQLVNFLLNDPEAGRALGLTRGVPPNSAIATSLAAGLDPQDQQIAEYVAYLREPGNSGPAPAPDPTGGKEIRSDLLTRHTQDVWFGKATVEQATEAFFQEAAKVLERAS
ncbi:ABC transporter substrate-binding protein [Nonomuraea diastatica]|uniref:Extracellular solute-binding protein n=1 Tax=Nonomuraea diastatica TaxID=1848329 RepID=A0A4R4WQM9_9ACTN|nr:extracellular solute-binding protein [Nonomuraea diastatica]TDD20094.1 extracellular solute-binding protein [Nonomuraea diastatica]